MFQAVAGTVPSCDEIGTVVWKNVRRYPTLVRARGGDQRQIGHVSSRVDTSEASDRSSTVRVLTPDRHPNMLRMIQGQRFRFGVTSGRRRATFCVHTSQPLAGAPRRTSTTSSVFIGVQVLKVGLLQPASVLYLRWAVIAPVHSLGPCHGAP